jgi:hypothetical protein
MAYDFNAFLKNMAKLESHAEIVQAATEECAKAEAASYGHRGALHQALGSSDYALRVKEFLSFMQHLVRPGTVTDADFAKYRPIVEALVTKGQLKPTVLEQFS